MFNILFVNKLIITLVMLFRDILSISYVYQEFIMLQVYISYYASGLFLELNFAGKKDDVGKILRRLHQ